MINPFVYFVLFLKASLFSSGGFSNLPSLHQDLLVRSWASDSQLGQGNAIGQISPGPNGLWVIALGYFTYGVPGAALALVAITLPLTVIWTILHQPGVDARGWLIAAGAFGLALSRKVNVLLILTLAGVVGYLLYR